jgi:hypothetical protein
MSDIELACVIAQELPQADRKERLLPICETV